MRLIFAVFAIFIPFVFAAGSASNTVCGCSLNYVSGGPTISCTPTCTNVGSTQQGTLTRNTNSITNSVAGITELFVAGTFTNTCPPSTASSMGGYFNQGPTACWYVMRTDVSPAVKVNGFGGCYLSGTYDMGNVVSGLARYYSAGAKFQFKVEITQGTGGCTASMTGATLVGDNAAKK